MNKSKLGDEIRDIISDLVSGRRLNPPPVIMPDQNDAAVDTAFDAMNNDRDDPAAVTTLRQKYEADYGFTNGFRKGGTSKDTWSIWYPWSGITEEDLQAAYSAGNLLGMKPAHLLALWITEGKIAHNPLTHGQMNDTFTYTPPNAIAADNIWSFVRGRILYLSYGADAFSPTHFLGGDNQLDAPSPAYDTKFAATLQQMADAGCPGPVSTADGRTNIANYLTLHEALHGAITSASGSSPGTIPANTQVSISYRVDRESLATWLYLQGGLFNYVYRKKAESLLGDAIDLTTQPWVTFVRWNGSEQTFSSLFSDGQDAVNTVFGETPQKMTEQELADYSPPDHSASRSPHGTAVHFKFLCEVVERWYP